MTDRKPHEKGELTALVLGALYALEAATQSEIALRTLAGRDEIGITLRRFRVVGYAVSERDTSIRHCPHVWRLTESGRAYRARLRSAIDGDPA